MLNGIFHQALPLPEIVAKVSFQYSLLKSPQIPLRPPSKGNRRESFIEGIQKISPPFGKGGWEGFPATTEKVSGLET
jgi:hypothetical protein